VSKAWTANAEAYLREHYPNESTEEIAKALGRTYISVRSRAKKLGLRKRGRFEKQFWSTAEEKYLRRHYADGHTAELAKALGRPIAKVYAKAKKLGLEKSAEYLRRFARLQPGHQLGRATQFPKGHLPANKGLRRPGWSAGRMRDTQFKKGQKPANTYPVGAIVKNADGYLRIKVRDDPEPPGLKGGSSKNWEFVHRRVWEDAHGPIPPGHRIWWKDGNHDNNALDNLELLTDKEHMARTTIHNLPPELKETIQLAGRLKRTIKRKERERGPEKSA
jgi:hypothetical protein